MKAAELINTSKGYLQDHAPEIDKGEPAGKPMEHNFGQIYGNGKEADAAKKNIIKAIFNLSSSCCKKINL